MSIDPSFYTDNEMGPMNAFLRGCLDPRVVAIMRE